MTHQCSICNHPKLRDITHDLMSRVPYRTIEKRYDLSRSAIDRHVSRHISRALKTLADSSMSLADAAGIAEPVLGEVRKLNYRTLAILRDAETSKERKIALAAIRESRRNLELIAKLTGELETRSPETAFGPMQVLVQYVDKRTIATDPPPQLTEGA